MSGYDKLVDLLPSLWRPQPGDRTLLAQWLAATGATLDDAAANAQHVLRAHWSDTADAALWATHYQAERRERKLPPPNVRDARDFGELQQYPWLRDLARLGALLDLPPWRDPASLRENVEEYRQRLLDVLEAYRAGLTTPQALRHLVDAALPEDMAAPLARQRGLFSLEEPVGLLRHAMQLTSIPTVQEGTRVAPLSRWVVSSAGTPSFIVIGTEADAIGAVTAKPMIERYTSQATPVGIGVAWTGTLAPGQALRFAPTRRTWLIRDGKLHASTLESAANAARDPSANGPWAEAAALPAGKAVALCGAPDGSLWAIQRTLQAWRVQRFSGTTFSPVETNAPAGPFNVLRCHGDSVWLGTDAGLFRCHLWPSDGNLRWDVVPGVGSAVHALSESFSGNLYVAGAQGLHVLSPSGFVLDEQHAGLALRAYLQDGQREILATANALFICRNGQYWRYEGASISENQPDWIAEATPDNTMTSPLPAITSMAVSPDGSLWLGSVSGLARWHVADGRTTRLEAFPDLVAAAVHALTVDDRGMLWIAAENGMFRFDGRDLAQHDLATGRWISAGRADSAYPSDISSESRGQWRFDRISSRWQRWSATARRFGDANLPDRAETSESVAAVIQRPAMTAELGSWDGSAFNATATISPAELRLRIKPDDTRIVAGALPYLPAPGTTTDETWRYLQMDEAPTPPTAGRPWWSMEGQLFPPPTRRAAVPGHHRDDSAFLTDPQGEGQFDQSAFTYRPSAQLWVIRPLAPAVGIRIRLSAPDPDKPLEPALAGRVWNLISRARPAGVPLQLMADGSIMKESTS